MSSTMKAVGLVLLLGTVTQIQSKAVPAAPSDVNNGKFLHDEKPLHMADDDGNLVPLILNDNEIMRNIGDFATGNISGNEDFNNSTAFLLYTKNNPNEYRRIYIDDEESLVNSHFNPEKQTRVITHGWLSSNGSLACTTIRDAYLKRGDYNVIVFDWSAYSKFSYLKAVKYVEPLAKHISKMISFLRKYNLDVDVLTMVGHSLGAHIIGMAGYYSADKIHKVVGLDPALPLFKDKKPGSRISVYDARHVEIIHTDAGSLGFKDAIGHFDFYPNGGREQRGCNDMSCSHSRSYEYYAESLNSDMGFYAVKCSSYEDFEKRLCEKKNVLMAADRIGLPTNGTYFLTTNDKFPFAIGKIKDHSVLNSNTKEPEVPNSKSQDQEDTGKVFLRLLQTFAAYFSAGVSAG